MHRVSNSTQQITTSTGTGDLNLSATGTVNGMQTFEEAGFEDGDTFPCRIEHTTADEFECCQGTYNGGVISRGAVEASSNDGERVDFSAGRKKISVVAKSGHLAGSVYTMESGASYVSPAGLAGVIVEKAAGSLTSITAPPNMAINQEFFVMDGRGDAGDFPITVSPASGTVNGAASVEINTGRACFIFIQGKTELKLKSVI